MSKSISEVTGPRHVEVAICPRAFWFKLRQLGSTLWSVIHLSTKDEVTHHPLGEKESIGSLSVSFQGR